MECRECGGEASAHLGDFDYSEATGLPVRLVGVTLIRCGACGAESVRIPKLARLHALIAGTLILKEGLLAPAEFRFLRKWLGLSGAAFARRMGVAAETISRWENGKMAIAAPADRALRLMVACEEPRTHYSAESLDRAGSENAPAMPIEMRASGKGWQGPKAA